jgi:hypothetical protein
MSKNTINNTNPGRDQILARLWELANLSPETTRGSIAGQIKAMSMIVAIEGLIPDRRQSKPQDQPTTPHPKPQIYVAEWLREQRESEAKGKQTGEVVEEVQAATAEAFEPEPPPKPPTSASDLRSNAENGSWVPDAATGTIFGPTDPRAPLWMRMKKRRRP